MWSVQRVYIDPYVYNCELPSIILGGYNSYKVFEKIIWPMHPSRDALYLIKIFLKNPSSYHNTNISGEFCVGVHNSPESIVDSLCISIRVHLYKVKVYQSVLTAYNIQF